MPQGKHGMREGATASRRTGATAAAVAAALAALALWAPPGGAAGDDDVSRLDPVEVTATRVERKVSEQAASVTVLGREEMEARQPVVAGDVLEMVPGVTVNRAGSAGALENVRIRGGRGNHTLVLIDGFPVNNATSGEFDVGSLPVDGFDRIEVVRGPQSALYGSNALSGVVNFLPRTGKEGRESAAGLAGGSHATLRWKGHAQDSGKGGSFYAGVSGVESGGTAQNDDTSIRSFLASGDTSPGPLGKVHAIALSTSALKGLPVTFRGPSDPSASMDRRDFLGGVRWEAPLSGPFALSVSGSYFNEYMSNDMPPEATLYGWSNSTIRSDRALLRLDGRAAAAGGVVLFAGGEVSRDRARGDDGWDGGSSSYSDHSWSRSAWLQAEVGPWKGAGASLGARVDGNEESGTTWTPRVAAYATVVPEVLRVRGAYGQGIRIPTITEKFMPPSLPWFDGGNRDLDPERSWSWEAGADLSFLGGAGRLSGTWFYESVRDMVYATDVVYGPDFSVLSPSALVNGEKAFSRGVEAELVVRGARAEGTLFYTFDDTRNEATGDRILRVPRHRGGVTVALFPAAGARLQADWVAETDTVDRAPYEWSNATRPGFARLDLSGRYGWEPAGSDFREVALTARLANALNRHYEEIRGYEAPDASFLLGVEAKI